MIRLSLGPEFVLGMIPRRSPSMAELPRPLDDVY